MTALYLCHTSLGLHSTKWEEERQSTIGSCVRSKVAIENVPTVLNRDASGVLSTMAFEYLLPSKKMGWGRQICTGRTGNTGRAGPGHFHQEEQALLGSREVLTGLGAVTAWSVRLVFFFTRVYLPGNVTSLLALVALFASKNSGLVSGLQAIPSKMVFTIASAARKLLPTFQKRW